MPFVQLTGHKIYYETYGHGECVLLMLPGSLGSTRLEYEKQFNYFDPSKFTIISWDAPGFGQSRPPERNYSDCYKRDAKLLNELMTEVIKVDKFALLGFSDGGRTAIALTSLYPERVSKLILVGTTSFNSPKEKQIFELCRNIDGWSNERRAKYEEVYGQALQSMWTKWVEANRKLADFLTPQLSQIVCPTLLLYGENDMIAPVNPHARHLKQHIASARVHIFPKTSHYCHQDRAHEFNKIVEKFLIQ